MTISVPRNKRPSGSGCPACRRSAAFTLVELLVVIGIIGTLLVLVVPAFTGLGRGQSMRSSVAQLRSTIALARQWAITRNEKTYVVFPDDGLNYNPPKNASMALRSYAVWAERSGYISDWRYLPPGVVFDPTDTVANNLFESTTDRVFPVIFPTNGATLNNMYCISFLPNGRLNQTGGNTLRVYMREGWVDVNTNTGVASAPTLKGTNYTMYFEVRPLTGQVRIREL